MAVRHFLSLLDLERDEVVETTKRVGAGPGPETRGRPLVWLGEVDNARSRAERHRVRDLVVGAVTGHSSHALVIGQRCPSCGSPAHGPPTVAEPAGWHVSTATAGALMAVAVHRDPIGVDLEPAGRLDGSSWADLVRVVPGLQALRDRRVSSGARDVKVALHRQ